MCGNGGTGADMGHASPKCTAEFKQGAVQLYRERGGAYAEIGRELGVGPGSVSDWVKRADAAGSDPSANPLPGRRGEPQAQEGERAARARERDAFRSERLLRRRAAVGARAERAEFAFMLLDEGVWAISEMCSALGATGRGHRAWRRRPPSAHDRRDGELAAMISEVRAASRGVCGPRRCSGSSGRRARAPPASAWRASCARAAGPGRRAAARGARRAGPGRPRRSRAPPPTWRSATSARTGRTGCGSRTSPA